MRKPKYVKRLFKRHHACPNRGDLAACRCAWKAKYKDREITLATWCGKQVDPRLWGPAEAVLRRFMTAVDDKNFDPAGEQPPLGTAETLKTFITEWKTHYAEAHGLTANSLDDMLNVLAKGALGNRSLEYLAGNSQKIERWLNAAAKTRSWSDKTWIEYRGLLFRVLKQATVWQVNGKPRLAVNPVAAIETRIAYQPEHFKQRTLIEDVEDRLFAVVDQLNRPQHRPNRNKLTQEKADEIRRALVNGARGVDLAKQYAVSAAVISSVKQGDIWNREKLTVGTKGTEMRRRLIGAFDGGLRAGEMMRIQLAHVNWRPVILRPVEGPVLEAYEIKLPPAITKGGKSTGEPEYVYAATSRFRQVLEARRFALKNNPSARQYIFGTEEGRQQKGFKRMWHALFALAELEYGRSIGVVWHSIRHEFISRLVELTKDPVLVQKLARHRDLETTQLYFHTRRDRELAAAASLERRA